MIKLRMRRKLMRMAVVASPLPDSGRALLLMHDDGDPARFFYLTMAVPVLDS